jgi:hypothetical protein
MRTGLTLLLFAAATPALAQAPVIDLPPPALDLPPPPKMSPARPAPPAATAPAPPRAEAAPEPSLPPPTDKAPVLVADEDKGGGVAAKVGTIAGGIAGGVAGAAAAGPVGKFAGGFIGKQLARTIFGDGKDDIPRVREVEQAPPAAADSAVATASAESAPEPN